MSMIRSGTASAKQNADALKNAGRGFKVNTVSYDEKSTISAKDNAKTAFECSNRQKAAYKEVLSADADHIDGLGKEFESLDKKLSVVLSAKFQ